MYQTKEGLNSLPANYGLTRVLFLKGDYEKAMPLINKILNLAPDKASDIAWNTWVMRLTILDKQREDLARENKADEADKHRRTIFTSILKLKMFDNNLGGPRYKSELQRLELRNQPQ
jgi:tetratricopeptide (TPR) repeat protein